MFTTFFAVWKFTAYGTCSRFEWFYISPIVLECVGVMFVQFLQDYACRASVDSLLNPMDTILSLRSKWVILHSAATAQSTMDYSTMAVDEGVVDSPISRVSIPNCVISPSPMWPRSVPNSLCMNKDNCTLVKCILYGDSRSLLPKTCWRYNSMLNSVMVCSFILCLRQLCLIYDVLNSYSVYPSHLLYT